MEFVSDFGFGEFEFESGCKKEISFPDRGIEALAARQKSSSLVTDMLHCLAMNLSQLTSIGWFANMMLDRREQAPFTFDDIYAAADSGALVDLFLKIDDAGVIESWAREPKYRTETESALADATEALRGREIRKAGVGENPLCMVIAIVLEAIQQNFRR